MPRSRSSPMLVALVTLVILSLAAVVLLLAPLGYREAEQRWFFYKHRNNPRCMYNEECFSMSCPPPNGVLCHWNKEEYKGVCVCHEGFGLRSDMLDAGAH